VSPATRFFIREAEIVGFKSFGPRVRFSLSPGLNALVGPNGSGKSNLLEAVSWVLGERQPPSSWRVSRGEELLFRGGEGRGRFSFAQVTLTFASPVEGEEFTLSRSLDRSGRSSFSLNGLPVRQKDLYRFLSFRGCPRPLAYVAQGLVDQVLALSPQGRESFVRQHLGLGEAGRILSASRSGIGAAEGLLCRLGERAEERRKVAEIFREEAERYEEVRRLERELEALEEALAFQRRVELEGLLRELERREREAVAEREAWERPDLPENPFQAVWEAFFGGLRPAEARPEEPGLYWWPPSVSLPPLPEDLPALFRPARGVVCSPAEDFLDRVLLVRTFEEGRRLSEAAPGYYVLSADGFVFFPGGLILFLGSRPDRLLVSAERRKKLGELIRREERLRQRREQVEEEVRRLPPPPPGFQPPTGAAARKEEIRVRLEALGPASPRAGERYREAQQELASLERWLMGGGRFLSALREAVEVLEAELEERFRTSLSALGDRLGEVFPRLAGGGEAFLRHQGEGGLELEFRFPGKRQMELSLLSGGERAIAGLSFLFALVLETPPLCLLLDEVDAALDPVNLRRFCSFLEELKEETQCLVITHQRDTMERADRLLGVTLEGGASRVLALDLSPFPVR
jgi:chromosome segregation ATPase